jgi:hypothetical protein
MFGDWTSVIRAEVVPRDINLRDSSSVRGCSVERVLGCPFRATFVVLLVLALYGFRVASN